MGYSRNTALVLALSMAILHLSQSQEDSGNKPDDYINAHSCIRRVLEVPPLTWDDELAKNAQSYADQRKDCKMIHSDKCGENMAAGPSLNGSYAVQMWLDERRYYDYDANKCKGQMCGHYTQMVWKDTQKVGCGRTKCDDGSWIVVCRYDPPGNIAGEKPY
ncbi:putative CAP domain-containing protein [Helianthus annuus]|nr:putative CAP domain-containing protein [Helianthus annuus]KAJ0522250.1 putative CAP domain-containing protein [Helianthus annuus]KAJ0697164.1 putative CAP domain-containing protein [Helianthus annuus]KAJ0700570.1 putative CAP domain-containing protein [Helianthus annuus]KAJ0884138.1 putative CAP superfamily protein [Helianthus annuus]